MLNEDSRRRDPRRKNSALCTATSKRTGKPCECIADRGSDTCRFHGGRGGRPISTGIHSKHLPKHLLRTYEETLAQTDPFRLTEKVAIQNALINQHLDAIGKLPPSEAILSTLSLLSHIEAMVGMECDGLPVEIEEALNEARSMLKSVDATREAESQVRALMVEQTKLVAAEAFRVERSKKYLTVEQAAALVAAVITVVNRCVTSEEEKEKVANELIRIIDRTDRQGTDGQSTGYQPIGVLPGQS